MDEPHIIAGKDLEKYWHRLEALREFHKLFNERTEVDERAIAIIGATFLDNILEDILSTFMVDDDKEIAKLLSYD